MSILGNAIIVGKSGETASIFASGDVLQSDTVFVQKGSKRINGEWTGSGFLLSNLNSFGTWTLTAQRSGENDYIQNVLIDAAELLVINVNYPRIPSAYQEVEWVGSDGDSWIDTNYPLSGSYSTFEFSSDVYAVDQGTDYPSFFGHCDTVKSRYVELYYDTDNAIHLYYTPSTGSSSQDIQVSAAFGAWHSVRILSNNASGAYNRKTTLTVDDSQVSAASSILATETTDPLLVLRYRTTLYPFYGMMKTATIKKNGSKVRELVPCYRRSDGVIGMYDLCGSICPLTNSPFYTNAGTGTLTKGADVF